MKNLRNIKVKLLSYQFRIEKLLIDVQKKDYMQLVYYKIRNWGDAINPLFASYITSKTILGIDIEALELFNSVNPNKHNYLGIGSILHHATANSVIWGSGILSPISNINKPKEICAVRGPLTAKVLKKNGINCPNIFGDPALLFPKFYRPKVKKKYKVGIVSHVVDWNSPLISQYRNIKDIKLINMRKTSLKLIDDVCQCENILSTSLHGLILADAYAIPACWLKISNKIAGNDFKFHDYHQSIKVQNTDPFHITTNTSINSLASACVKRDVNLNLDLLFKVCPYKDND